MRPVGHHGDVAIVLWTGHVGGAETLGVRLCATLNRLGRSSKLVFVQDAADMKPYLTRLGVPYAEMGLMIGSHVVRQPKRFAEAVNDAGRSGAVLVSPGYLACTLRLGGYRGVILGVEHGSLLRERTERPRRRALAAVSRASGVLALDALVCVSEYMRSVALQHLHPNHVEMIYNGVDVREFSPRERVHRKASVLRVGAAGRLIAGKGFEVLIEAAQRLYGVVPVEVLIAGEGPERASLEALSMRCPGVPVRFLGVVSDMADFWSRCDIAVVPSTFLIESFGMVAVEAMACGVPVIASANGGLREIVVDGVTGFSIQPGSSEQLAQHISTYFADERLRRSHATAARQRAEDVFSLDTCARRYVGLIDRGRYQRTRKNESPRFPFSIQKMVSEYKKLVGNLTRQE